MDYILCEFTEGYVGLFYQEVNNGEVVRITDVDGNTLILPNAGEDNYIPYCSVVKESNPQKPSWGL
jgi:hypothetical protein